MIEPPSEPLLPQKVLERSTGFVQNLQSTANQVSGFVKVWKVLIWLVKAVVLGWAKLLSRLNKPVELTWEDCDHLGPELLPCGFKTTTGKGGYHTDVGSFAFSVII